MKREEEGKEKKNKSKNRGKGRGWRRKVQNACEIYVNFLSCSHIVVGWVKALVISLNKFKDSDTTIRTLGSAYCLSSWLKENWIQEGASQTTFPMGQDNIHGISFAVNKNCKELESPSFDCWILLRIRFPFLPLSHFDPKFDLVPFCLIISLYATFELRHRFVKYSWAILIFAFLWQILSSEIQKIRLIIMRMRYQVKFPGNSAQIFLWKTYFSSLDFCLGV